jgi:hypothetical protein
MRGHTNESRTGGKRMSENLGHFLVDLACDPDLMAQFIGDPATVLAKFDLTEQERTIVMTRDSRLLADALGTTGFALGQGVDVVTPERRKAPARKRKAPRKPIKKAPAKKAPKKRAPAKPSRKKR